MTRHATALCSEHRYSGVQAPNNDQKGNTMHPGPVQQNKLGKTILVISIIFVLIFAAMLIARWFNSPEMFVPVFG